VSTRAGQFSARVERRDELSPHLVRLTLSTEGFVSTGVPDELPGYLPDSADATWLESPSGDHSRLAEVVERIDWPEGDGYFWMAGESAQMRAVRKHLMRERRLPAAAYDVMGYWRASTGRQPRAVDPGPIWRAGKAQGLSDEEIWARYDSTPEDPDLPPLRSSSQDLPGTPDKREARS